MFTFLNKLSLYCLHTYTPFFEFSLHFFLFHAFLAVLWFPIVFLYILKFTLAVVDPNKESFLQIYLYGVCHRYMLVNTVVLALL